MKNAVAAAFAVFLFLSLQAGAQDAPAPAPPRQTEVAAEEVAAAIAKGVKFLKSAQGADGSWPYSAPTHVQGATALAVYALSEAGVPSDDPAIVKGMDAALSRPIQGTYEAACIALAAASSNPGRYIRTLAQARDYLVGAQLSNGMWAYAAGTVDRSGGDNSNTQFALLGLYATMSVGLAVPEATLTNAYNHYTRTQNGDGGWGYRPGDISYGSMTAAAVASLDITGSRLYVESDKCGQYRTDPRMAAGFMWLVRNFTVRENPRKEPAWHLYYLYAMERVGVFTGERYFGGRDWYQEGARVIIGMQNNNGSWTSDAQVLPNTCFALLFLAKGNVPVLINKLAHAGEWNADVHDVRNLTRYVSPHLGQQVGWQSVTLAESQAALLSAPILYVTGHTFPEVKPDELERFKAFFDHGGFMLAEACCGSKQFDAGFRAFVEKAFPGYPVTPLDRTHLVYHALFDVKSTQYPLYSVDAGCRTAIIYSPHDLSCAWERANLAEDEDAFKLGANIAAYVTGKEKLASRLAQYKPKAGAGETAVTAAPAAFAFAQAKYAGAWNPHPMSGPRLLEFLNEQAGLYVSARPVEISLTDPNLSNYPFLYMTGPNTFALSGEEKAALKEYLERGGFLFADATTGKTAFDESFRSLMASILPNSPLEPLAHDHAIYHVAFETVQVQYTASVRERSPNLDTLTLYGARIGDRLSVVYSPFDIGCALERQPSYGSRGLLTPDAFRAAANIVLYSLTH